MYKLQEESPWKMEKRKEGRRKEGKIENKEDEKPILPSDETLTVAVLSSGWKSSKGGLSTISRELAIQLAKHLNVEVYVYLPMCTEEDKRVACSHSYQLIEAEELPGFEPIDWLTSLPKGFRPHCLIGHGLHLGRQIPLIKRYHDCKWIQIVDTAPEELGMYKSYEEAIFKGEQKHQAEVKLCELADQVVAVGPKLADAYSRCLRFSSKDQDVINLTPSIFTEFLNVQQAIEERNTFSVLVSGRGDGEDFMLKGYDIAVQAVSKLKDSSYQLMFVGAPAGREDEVAEKLLQHGIHRSQLTVRRFKKSREELTKLFCEVDLAIMPSRTEGFGLTALEALSAGLPVLVSGNSGLGDALKKVPSGFSHVVDSEDPKEWAKAIKIVRQKGREVRLEDANVLREKYALKYNWQKQCDCLVEKMLHLSFDKTRSDLQQMESEIWNISEKLDTLMAQGETDYKAMKLKIDVETMKPTEHSKQDRIPFSTVELGGFQNVGQHFASEVPVSSELNQSSCVNAEVPEVPTYSTSKEEVLRIIALQYLASTPLTNRDDVDNFLTYMGRLHAILTGAMVGEEHKSGKAYFEKDPSEAAPPPIVSSRAMTNYARLCRLLVDIGSEALRDTFDKVHPPSTLRGVVTSSGHYPTLQSLYRGRKKVLNPTHWRKLYPVHSGVTSASFDITLLTVLLRNICGFSPPATGWDDLPPSTDTSTADDIARVKYYRDTVYRHANQASVDDASFNAYWHEIREALVRLGGTSFRGYINNLEHDTMDPDMEEHYRELMKQWKKDDDSIKEKLEEMEESIRDNLEQRRSQMENITGKMKEIKERLDTLMASLEENKDEENLIETLKQMGHELKNSGEKFDPLRESSQDKDKLQMKSEMANISDKLDTLIAQRETDDEDEIKDDLKEIKRDIETIIEKLKNQITSGEEENLRETLEPMRHEVENVGEKFDSLRQSSQDEDTSRNKLQQMESDIASMREMLDTKRETEDEENDRDSLEHRKKEVPDIEEKLDTLKNRLTLEETKLRMEVDELFIRNAAIKLEADYKECVRVLPYLQNGEVEIHVYFYSDKSGIPTGLNNAAQTLFEQKGWKLKWKDLYNDACNLLKVTAIRYSSGKPKRLEASQVDEIVQIIDKHLHNFCKHRNVTAVHPSFKVTNSEDTQEACISVYVLGKGQIPLGESLIPPTIGSYPVDIVNGFFVGTNDPYKPTKAHKQQEFLRLGASIGVNEKQSSGTLGAIVEDVESGTLYALSCNHVLSDADEEKIIHPGLDVYLNYLHYNLNEYKGELAKVLGSTVDLPQFGDDILQEPELKKTFSDLKAIKEENIASLVPSVSKYTLKQIQSYEGKLEKAFGERPRVIAKYLAGVACNVQMNGEEHFIDAAIAKLEEDEIKALRAEKKVRIIDTSHYPSGECLSATAEVKDLFKSGSATGFTQTNLLAEEVLNRPTFIRGISNSRWIDVECIQCNATGPAPSVRCKLCEPHGWYKRCLCIPEQGGQPFLDKGDSGAVIFEKRRNEPKSSGFAIIVGKLDTGPHKFAIASPLQFALEALSQRVSEFNSKPCQLKLASEF